MSGKTAKDKQREGVVSTQTPPPIDPRIIGLIHNQSNVQNKGLSASVHVGPLPPPAVLAEYQKLVPDAPERIFAMTEKSQTARLEAEMPKHVPI